MKVTSTIITFVVITQIGYSATQSISGTRATRQTNADQMIQNILQWLQGVYMQNTRKIRQGTVREYLPPSNTQKPRPFQTPEPADTNEVGYAPSGITPQPPFPTYPNPPTGGSSVNGGNYPTPRPDITPPHTGYPTEKPQPPFTQETTTYNYQRPTNGFPTERPNGFPTERPNGFTTARPTTGYPTTTYPTTGYPDYTTRSTQQSTTGYQTQRPFPTNNPPFTSSVNEGTTNAPLTSFPNTQGPTEGVTFAPDENNVLPTQTPTDEDLKHPPHIHAIDVQCAKDMMTINIEFNRVFEGVIYSKGFYSNADCRYVKENSGQVKYSFTVSLNSCGTEFVNAFDTQGQSYLENVLVLQNEPGIQEIWDTIRSVRCLWEGNLNQALSVALSVGMLTQEIVTFSGDTAMAKLDIQLGRGPFAQPANGLVKIGELMTLVVSVSGDPGFDIQVRDCKAKDSSGENEVALTDSNGCVLKPKLFGAFQKTRETRNSGASIIAYAFFNAFKFPDVMDLMIECNIELCKTDCQMCPEPNQKVEPGRRRRDVRNETFLADAVRMGKMLHVILPEDLSEGTTIVNLSNDSLCMSTQGFVLSAFCLISMLVVSSFLSACLWLKNQQLRVKS